MKIILLLILTILSGCLSVHAQVEHNYPVGPQNTDCDSLKIENVSMESALDAIKNTVFRFDQKFKISRTQGVRAGHFYSCDGKLGYLVLTVDRDTLIFGDVPKPVWNEFITNPDLDGFYKNKISGKYQKIGQD